MYVRMGRRTLRQALLRRFEGVNLTIQVAVALVVGKKMLHRIASIVIRFGVFGQIGIKIFAFRFTCKSGLHVGHTPYAAIPANCITLIIIVTGGSGKTVYSIRDGQLLKFVNSHLCHFFELRPTKKIAIEFSILYFCTGCRL